MTERPLVQPELEMPTYDEVVELKNSFFETARKIGFLLATKSEFGCESTLGWSIPDGFDSVLFRKDGKVSDALVRQVKPGGNIHGTDWKAEFSKESPMYVRAMRARINSSGQINYRFDSAANNDGFFNQFFLDDEGDTSINDFSLRVR